MENLAAAGPSIVEQFSLVQLLVASKNTLLLTVLSMPLAVTLGLFLALMRKSRLPIFSWPASIYIEVVRGTPLLMQLYLIYYSLPQIGQWIHERAPAISDEWFILNNFTVGVMCLAGNYAAYESEIHRAGLEAVDKGQREAALSIGMSERQAFLRVVMPQALRIVVPPIINDLIAMLKDSSLVSIIGVTELLNVALGVGKGRSNVAQMLVVAALFYLVLSLPCYFIGKWIERRLKAQGAPELHLENVHGH